MATIMVVDDDSDVLEIFGKILSGAGHAVVRAGGGIEALNLLDATGSLDLLITDVIMPGLNGFNLARMARTRRPLLKILYLTGSMQAAETAQDIGEHYGRLLVKPILAEDLRNEVNAVLAA